jgi:hypothetical protein
MAVIVMVTTQNTRTNDSAIAFTAQDPRTSTFDITGICTQVLVVDTVSANMH